MLSYVMGRVGKTATNIDTVSTLPNIPPRRLRGQTKLFAYADDYVHIGMLELSSGEIRTIVSRNQHKTHPCVFCEREARIVIDHVLDTQKMTESARKYIESLPRINTEMGSLIVNDFGPGGHRMYMIDSMPPRTAQR